MALALKWSDIKSDRIHVQRSLSHGSSQWRLDEPKTAQGRSVVAVPRSASAALQTHAIAQAKSRLSAGSTWRHMDLVFPNRAGDPMEYRRLVQRHFRAVCRAAGVEGIRPYDLRHTCAMLLLSAGENTKVVSERLGHTSAVLTLDTYSHILTDMQQHAAERLEAMLFGTAATA